MERAKQMNGDPGLSLSTLSRTCYETYSGCRPVCMGRRTVLPGSCLFVLWYNCLVLLFVSVCVCSLMHVHIKHHLKWPCKQRSRTIKQLEAKCEPSLRWTCEDTALITHLHRKSIMKKKNNCQKQLTYCVPYTTMTIEKGCGKKTKEYMWAAVEGLPQSLWHESVKFPSYLKFSSSVSSSRTHTAAEVIIKHSLKTQGAVQSNEPTPFRGNRLSLWLRTLSNCAVQLQPVDGWSLWKWNHSRWL